jgi:hypothetical protein
VAALVVHITSKLDNLADQVAVVWLTDLYRLMPLVLLLNQE